MPLVCTVKGCPDPGPIRLRDDGYAFCPMHINNTAVGPHPFTNAIGNVFPLVAGRKDDQGKLRWSLLPWEALDTVVAVLCAGATKYGDNDWRSVTNWRDRYDSALERHMVAWRRGETLDKDTRLPHLAHAVCCLLFLLTLDVGTGP